MLQMINDLEITHKVLVIKNPSRQDVIAAYKECNFLKLDCESSEYEILQFTSKEYLKRI